MSLGLGSTGKAGIVDVVLGSEVVGCAEGGEAATHGDLLTIG